MGGSTETEARMLDQAEALREMVDRLAGEAKEAAAAGDPAWPVRAVRASAAGHSPEQRNGHAVPAASPRAGVVAIASGKGGVGKTTLSVSLAAELVRRGRRVLLLDADLGTANADIACGLTPEATLADVLRGTHRLADIQLDAPGGFQLLPGASGLADPGEHGWDLPPARLGALLRQMDALEAANDVILIDVGAGVGPVVQAFCAAAARLLVVTTPDPTAVTDAYALLKTLDAAGTGGAAHASVVVNLAADRAEGRGVHDRLEAACRHFLGFSPPLAGVVPADPAVAASVRHRLPLLADAADSPAGHAMQRLAATLDRRGGHEGASAAPSPHRASGFSLACSGDDRGSLTMEAPREKPATRPNRWINRAEVWGKTLRHTRRPSAFADT